MTQPRYEVSYAPLAIDDLRVIHRYVAHVLQAPNTAKRQVRRIETAVRGLSTLPLRHEIVGWEPWSDMGVRKLKVDNFLVFYRVSDERRAVEVILILYAGSNVEEMASQSER